MYTVDASVWVNGFDQREPGHEILGGARDKVKAYASTYPNIGKPEDYAEHALECKKQGYKAYKVYAYICWNPHT